MVTRNGRPALWAAPARPQVLATTEGDAMTDEIQADSPPPRRRFDDVAGNNPFRKPAPGIPLWVWLLVGLGALLCFVPVLAALSWSIMSR